MVFEKKFHKLLLIATIYLFGNLYSNELVNAMPAIVNISAPSQIGRYEKLEITFDITGTVAQNFQLPFDPAPPSGIDLNHKKHRGISVDAEFTPDNWQTIYRQPAFYYHYYQDGGLRQSWDRSMQHWYYPTGKTAWKVRFSPNLSGIWQYRLRATDQSGSSMSGTYSVTVTDSNKKGFMSVSKKDPRYFEYDDGSLFLSLGFNAGEDITDSPQNHELGFTELQKNNIQLIRKWISGLHGAAWMQWVGGRGIYDGYLPRTGIRAFHDSQNNRDLMTLRLEYPEGRFDACVMEYWNDYEAVKPHTTYRLRISYWGRNIKGPRIPGSNYGLAGKISESWHPNCYEPSVDTALTSYGIDSSNLSTIEGIWHSNNYNFLPHIYIGLENVTEGQVNILSVSMRQVLGDGNYGPEILRQPSMECELVIPDLALYSMDKYLELAEKYGIYLKLVLMEKNDPIYYRLDDDGTFVTNGEQANQDGFYGLGRAINKTRWLQQAWWRYVQARWGYSPNIHSWELTNEGDPFSKKHWEMTDEFGKFMHCRVFGVQVASGDGNSCTFQHPNRHMITTSFWHSFPGYAAKAGDGFWGNPKYPNVDYADVHAYIPTSTAPAADKLLMEKDAAYYHLWHSRQYRTWNLKMPIVRGEAGMVPHSGSTDDKTGLGLQKDLLGTWYHNYVWSTLDSGALYEIYWYADPHIYSKGIYDHRPVALSYHNFMAGIALNNGNYRDLGAEISNPNIRVVGQKDLISGSAHLWIQNKNHTWKNAVDLATIPPVSGTIKIGGFAPEHIFSIDWWDTYETKGQITGTKTCVSSADGFLEIPVSSLKTDIALKIKDAMDLPLETLRNSGGN